MSTQGAREPPRRGQRRRKNVLNLDLNNTPISEGRDQVGTSNQGGAQHGQPVPPPTIDLDAIEDEVVESSESAFAEARRKSRRNHGRPEVVDVDLEDRTRTGQPFRNKRRRVPVNQRVPSNQTIINCEPFINVESYAMGENITRPSGPVVPPPPKEPTFSCPICMGSLVEEMSTKCGHIFCKECIKAAIAVQPKCPTCRKRVTTKELIRVFLPATS